MAVYIKAFFDWVEQTAALSDAERGRLFVAILEYGRTGEVPELEGNERFLFPVFKAQLDREENTTSVRSKSGAKGGRRSKSLQRRLLMVNPLRSQRRKQKQANWFRLMKGK